MKKVISVLSLVALLVCLMASCVCATGSNGVTPRWTGVADVNAFLDFYGTEGEVTLTSTKDSSTTKLEGVVTIYKWVNGQWVYVDSMTKSVTRGTLFISIVFDGTSGVQYKMEVEITAYNGTTVIEEITDVKYATCP
jgi:hypothetical protein